MTEETLKDTVCSIPLTRGLYAIIDKCDYEQIHKYKWYAKKGRNGWYAARNVTTPTGRKTVLMHIEILGVIEGYETDHWNHNGLDNRRSNLRHSTKKQNQQNQLIRVKGSRYSSRYKGVRKRYKGWEARICVNKKQISLGHYDGEDGEVKAARAYDKAALECFGDFANLNFPEDINVG